MIDYEKRAMIEAEDKYTFRQSSQISSQTGLIGYLRADMDTDGNGFFSSWNDYRKDLKTDEFKQEFDEVINSLREEGDILHNRKDLAYYCYTNPQSKMPTEQDYYGVRVDTDKYTYLLRLNPNKGEYNLYCYCYVKEWLNGHMKDAAKGICEVCGRKEILTPQEAFDQGWDYPPMMGHFGVLSPRTCPNCNMMDTVWAAITMLGKRAEDLTDEQQQVIVRIVSEPDSILVHDE